MTAHTAPHEPDLLLLQQFIDTGNPDTFAEIVQRYGRVVYAASLRILGDQGRAQDVSQETFFRLMQRPKLVTHSLAGWLHRTATHLALDYRRSDKSRRLRELSYGIDQQQFKSIRDNWAEVSSALDQALNEIEEPTRGLLIKHFLQGIPQQDLAAELDVSPATLSRRIKSGLEMLQTQLRKKGVYVALLALAGFCASNTTAAVPAIFVSEMAKMNLIASIRQLPPSAVPPPGPYPPKYPLHPNPSHFVPAKFAIALVTFTVVMAAYAFAVGASWMHANPPQTPAYQDVHQEPPDQHAK